MATGTKKKQDFATLPVGGKVLVLLFLLAAFSAAYFFALYQPLREDIAAANQQKVQLDAQFEEAQDRQTRFRELNAMLAERQSVDRQNLRVLPEASEIPAFLQDLNRLAELSGLSIQQVEPRPEEPQELYVRLPVTLELRGRYHQIAKFFYNVSNLERAINMENLVLGEPEAADDGELRLSVNVLATSFRRLGDHDMGGEIIEGGA
jgi:type IV pilus assembly protein PilO